MKLVTRLSLVALLSSGVYFLCMKILDPDEDSFSLARLTSGVAAVIIGAFTFALTPVPDTLYSWSPFNSVPRTDEVLKGWYTADGLMTTEHPAIKGIIVPVETLPL